MSPVLYEVVDGVATITLAAPDTRNVLTAESLGLLEAHLSEAASRIGVALRSGDHDGVELLQPRPADEVEDVLLGRVVHVERRLAHSGRG